MTLESDIEKAAKAIVDGVGGELIKIATPGTRGFPDRIALLPGGRLAFIEFKQPGKQPRPEQWHWIYLLRRCGFEAFWTNDAQDVARWVHDADAE